MVKWKTRREYLGEFTNIFTELGVEELGVDSLKRYHHIPVEVFQELPHRIGPRITKKDMNWMPALTPEFKLLPTICYLSTTMRINDLEFSYRCIDKIVSLFVRDVCEAIYN